MDGGGGGGGGMWLSQSPSHQTTRFSSAAAGGRPVIGSPSRLEASAAYGGGACGISFGNAMGGRSGDAAAVGISRGREGFPGAGRVTIPQRYTRSRERIYGNASSMGGAAGTASGAGRRAVRHRGISRGNELPSTANATRKLPLIGGGSGMGTRDGLGGMCRTMFPNSQRLCDAAPGKELVVREEGCNTSAVCTIQVWGDCSPARKQSNLWRVMFAKIQSGSLDLMVKFSLLLQWPESLVETLLLNLPFTGRRYVCTWA